MKRIQIAREVRDELHATEAAMDALLAQTEATLARMLAAKAELGLTGTVGDAAIARMRDTVADLQGARETLVESHQEVYAVYGMLNFKGPRMDRTYDWDTALHERVA